MTPEMFAGYHPDQPRALLGPRIPLPESQTTQEAAPFSMEMVQGSIPIFPRPHQRGHLGFINNQMFEIVGVGETILLPGLSGATVPLDGESGSVMLLEGVSRATILLPGEKKRGSG